MRAAAIATWPAFLLVCNSANFTMPDTPSIAPKPEQDYLAFLAQGRFMIQRSRSARATPVQTNRTNEAA